MTTMTTTQPHWTTVTDSEFHREREALKFLREHLAGYEPLGAWANFQFLPLEGGFFDVDLLVFSRAGLFLVELATHSGQLEIGQRSWMQTRQNGEVEIFDSPLELADQKAEQFKTLLERRMPDGVHAPRVQALVFVTQPNAQIHFDIDEDAPPPERVLFPPGAEHLPENAPQASILDALLDGEGPGVRGSRFDLTPKVLKRVQNALDEVGLEQTPKYRRVSDYDLGELLEAAPKYQDFVAQHRSRDKTLRARVFHGPRGATDDELARLQEAARREYAILRELDHDAILTAVNHYGHETRPAIFFEHPEEAVRLDHWLERTENVSAKIRFQILQSVAEALRFAHDHRVVHRALSPQSVLVVPTDTPDKAPDVRVYNWHTSQQADDETGTRHVEDYLDGPSKFYLAPELSISPDVNESADIFSLGALAYFLFSGEAPAHSLAEFAQTIARQNGLRLSALEDRVDPKLDELVHRATHSNPTERHPTAAHFLQDLQEARSASLAVGPRGVIDPLDAQPGDILDDRFKILLRLGKGSTATALLAEDADDNKVVLKIANDDAHAARLDAEADRALTDLDHELIVDLYDRLDIGGRRTLVLEYAGTTLRDKLRETSALSLDEQRRFGRDMCRILEVLEDQNVYHKDIKPSNLGLGQPGGQKTKRQLMLFDFSLAGAGSEHIDVGTDIYRDPFLQTRTARRWDTSADRYSAGLVLYEMVTQQLPQWGDGRANPAFDRDSELRLDAERFPALIRDDLRTFFRRCFSRDLDERFGNAEEMRAAWEDIFERTAHPEQSADEIERTIRKATPQTKLRLLGLSELASEAADAKGLKSVRDLLEASPKELYFLEGYTRAVGTELADLRERLAELYPSLEHVTDHGADPKREDARDLAHKSVDELLDYLHGSRSGQKKKLRDLVAAVLASERPELAFPWKARPHLIERTDLSPEEFAETFDQLREAWHRKRVLKPLRDEIVDRIDANGGVMEARELSQTVLAIRGSLKSDNPDRLAAASAVTRAAVEAELADDEPRIQLMRQGAGPTFLATRGDMLDVLDALGERADDLADQQPLASSDRAYRELSDILHDAQLQPLPRHRLLTLACDASRDAAVSQRFEIYPRAMDAARALKLTSSILLRKTPLSVGAIRAIVRDRYPEAAELPGRPELDDAIERAGLELTWDTTAFDSHGGYVTTFDLERRTGRRSDAPRLTRSTAAGTTASLHSRLSPAERKDRLDYFQEQLQYKIKQGGVFILTVSPKRADHAARRLAEAFDMQLVDLDEVFLRNMRRSADSKNIKWHGILQADGPYAPKQYRENFARFLKYHALGTAGDADKHPIEDDILSRGDRLLLTHPGLLARYKTNGNAMRILENLRERADSKVIWLLVPADEQSERPVIDGVEIPVFDDSQYTRVPRSYLA